MKRIAPVGIESCFGIGPYIGAYTAAAAVVAQRIFISPIFIVLLSECDIAVGNFRNSDGKVCLNA